MKELPTAITTAIIATMISSLIVLRPNIVSIRIPINIAGKANPRPNSSGLEIHCAKMLQLNLLQANLYKLLC